MLTRAPLRPGQKGTHRFAQKYGEHLACVRCRYDYPDKTRHKTVEHNRHPALGDTRPDPGGAQYPAGLGAHRLRREESAAADQGRQRHVLAVEKVGYTNEHYVLQIGLGDRIVK